MSHAANRVMDQQSPCGAQPIFERECVLSSPVSKISELRDLGVLSERRVDSKRADTVDCRWSMEGTVDPGSSARELRGSGEQSAADEAAPHGPAVCRLSVEASAFLPPVRRVRGFACVCRASTLSLSFPSQSSTP